MRKLLDRLWFSKYRGAASVLFWLGLSLSLAGPGLLVASLARNGSAWLALVALFLWALAVELLLLAHVVHAITPAYGTDNWLFRSPHRAATILVIWLAVCYLIVIAARLEPEGILRSRPALIVIFAVGGLYMMRTLAARLRRRSPRQPHRAPTSQAAAPGEHLTAAGVRCVFPRLVPPIALAAFLLAAAVLVSAELLALPTATQRQSTTFAGILAGVSAIIFAIAPRPLPTGPSALYSVCRGYAVALIIWGGVLLGPPSLGRAVDVAASSRPDINSSLVPVLPLSMVCFALGVVLRLSHPPTE
jgi:hypothetical protein